jgi:hypothetical protein
MGILKRLTPKKTPAVLKPIVNVFKSADSAPSSANLLDPGHDPDDEPTYFTTFMVMYWGFFGITLVAYPYLHTSEQCPFPNPMAYWTSLTGTEAMIFRLAGLCMLTLVVGPFFDEIFGGPGVFMMAFTRQMCFINTLTLFLFLYYSFYAPLETAIPVMWQAQAALAGVLAGWSFVEISTTELLKTFYTLFTVLQFGFFALGLMSVPDLLFGPPSPFAYWSDWSELALMCARSMGITMFVVFLLGYFYFYGKAGGFTKLCTVFNIVIFGLMALPSFFGGELSVEAMWKIQFVMQIPLVVIGLYLEFSGATGPWSGAGGSITMACPACGLNPETYNLVNLIWYMPFLLAFAYDPNKVMGPSNPMGPDMAMFTVEFDEVALWFGQAWSGLVTIMVLGPYFFGLPAASVTKQLTVAYFLYCCLFGYALYFYSVFNLMVAGPLTGLNVVFFLWGLYLSLTTTTSSYMSLMEA